MIRFTMLVFVLFCFVPRAYCSNPEHCLGTNYYQSFAYACDKRCWIGDNGADHLAADGEDGATSCYARTYHCTYGFTVDYVDEECSDLVDDLCQVATAAGTLILAACAIVALIMG